MRRATSCSGWTEPRYNGITVYTGHIKRHNTLEKLFLEGTCEGRRGRGRPRRRWTQDIGEWMGVSTVEAGRQALERGEFRQAVWEATSITDPP